MVSGDLNGTANTKLSGLPTSGVKGQAIPDLDRFRAGFELEVQQCTLPCAHPHVPRCGPVRCEGMQRKQTVSSKQNNCCV